MLAGVSDIAEIATMCALETGIQIVAIVDPQSSLSTFKGVLVATSFRNRHERFSSRHHYRPYYRSENI